MQNNGKEKTKKRAARANLIFHIRRKRVLHVQIVFLLIRSISLETIFIVVPRLALHDLIFCLHVLLTRASLLALPKSIYYNSSRYTYFTLNRSLPCSKNPHFQNEAKCTTFLVKMSFICMRIKIILISKTEYSTSF